LQSSAAAYAWCNVAGADGWVHVPIRITFLRKSVLVAPAASNSWRVAQ